MLVSSIQIEKHVDNSDYSILFEKTNQEGCKNAFPIWALLVAKAISLACLAPASSNLIGITSQRKFWQKVRLPFKPSLSYLVKFREKDRYIDRYILLAFTFILNTQWLMSFLRSLCSFWFAREEILQKRKNEGLPATANLWNLYQQPSLLAAGKNRTWQYTSALND